MRFLAICALALLAACQTTESMYGKGPLPNKSRVEAAYQEYLKSFTPGVFFVSENGAYGYSYCRDANCSGQAISVAKYSCLRGSKGAPCWIYAYGSNVVWDETATRDAPNPATQTAPTPAPKSPSQ